jgi:tetratricopeptide (TPR) repeat protein
MHAGIAQSIDPTLGGIDLILGNLAEADKRPAEALQHYNRAIELEPKEPRPYHWRGLMFAIFGYMDKCTEDLQQAAALEPENPNVQFGLSGCLFGSGQWDLARIHNQRGLDLGNAGGYSQLVYQAFTSGDREAGLREITALIDSGVNRELWGYLEARLSGQTESGIELLTQLTHGDGDYGMALIILGEQGAFFEYLMQADEAARSLGSIWAPNLSEWRSDPRFVTAMMRFGALDLWQTEGLPPDCAEENGKIRCGLMSAAP